MSTDKIDPGTVTEDGKYYRCECCTNMFDGDDYYSLATCNDAGIGVVVCAACSAFVDRLLARTTQPGDQHPTQPTVMVGGVRRFKQNAIVRWLLDAGPFDMNIIAVTPFCKEDRRQFAQLIGYSVSGYGDLDYATAIDEPTSHAQDEDANKVPDDWGQFSRVDVAVGDELDAIYHFKPRLAGESDAVYRERLKATDLCEVCKLPMADGCATYVGVSHWTCAKSQRPAPNPTRPYTRKDG